MTDINTIKVTYLYIYNGLKFIICKNIYEKK